MLVSLLCIAGMMLAVEAAHAQTAPQPNPTAEDATLPVIPVAALRPEETPPAPSSAPALLPPIIVTGEKLGRTLDQTATSVNLTTGQQLDDYGDESIADLFRRVANVTAGQDGTFSIRGVSNTGPEGFAFGQPVITQFLDGVALDRIGQFSGLSEAFDLQQVEVLRGPQSTSQGRNALAGAVVALTRDPTDYWDLRARLRLAELGTRQAAVAGGGPLGAGLAFRVAYDERATDGYIRNHTLDDDEWGREDSQLLRAKLGWRPTFAPDLNLVLTVSQVESENGNDGGAIEFIPDGGKPRTATDNIAAASDRRSDLASLRAEYAISERYTLYSTTAWLESRDDSTRDFDRSATGEGFVDSRYQGRTRSQELRLQFEDLGTWRGVVGAYAGAFRDGGANHVEQGRIRLADYAAAFTPPPLLPAAEVIGQIDDLLVLSYNSQDDFDDDADNLALFAETDWAASERLTLSFGLRYDREQRDVNNQFTATAIESRPATPGTPIAIPGLSELLASLPPLNLTPLLGNTPIVPGTDGLQTASGDYDALLPKIGIRYALSETLTLHATYSEAYRAGGIDILFTTGELKPYDPEFTRNLELGLRATVLDGRLRLAGNVYAVDWRDQQVEVLTPQGNDSFTENAANSTLYGAELESQLRVGARWQTYASLGYARTRFDEYATVNGDYRGNDFVRAPRFTGSLGAVYRADAGWFASSSISHTDRYFLTPENDPRERSDAYTLLDLRLGYEAPRWSLIAYGRNLLDEDYRTYRFLLEPGFGVEQTGALEAYGAPQVLGVEANLRF